MTNTQILLLLFLLALAFYYWKTNPTKSLPKNNDHWETWWDAPDWATNSADDSDPETQDWKDIHLSFQGSYGQILKDSWITAGFTYQQTKEWIDIGLSPTDYSFCSWLKSTKNLTAEQTLNNHNLTTLKKEFQKWLTTKRN